MCNAVFSFGHLHARNACSFSKLSHNYGYGEIDWTETWDNAVNDIPEFKLKCLHVLKKSTDHVVFVVPEERKAFFAGDTVFDC